MEQYTYTRPREKLRERGVTSLSSSELLQVIIGSGSQYHSAARIAKTVLRELENTEEPLKYSSLIKLPGIGHAKACQILSAVELGRRQHLTNAPSSPTADEFKELKSMTKRFLRYGTYDGEGKLLSQHKEDAHNLQAALAAIKKMFARALHQGAHSLHVGIGSRMQVVEVLDEETLELIKKIFETADLLEIRLKLVWLVNRTSNRPIYRKEFG